MRRRDGRSRRNWPGRGGRRRWPSAIGADCDVELAVIADRRRSDGTTAPWLAAR